MGFPPGEAREESANASAHCDFFGAGRLRPADVKRLVESEAVSTSDMFVVVSDVWLDKPTTLSRLKMIFEGFDGSDAIPTMFVLMGDFCSTPLNTGNTQQGANFETYKQGFDRLASLLEHFPRLRCGTFPSTTLRVPDTCTVQSTGPTLPNPGYTRGRPTDPFGFHRARKNACDSVLRVTGVDLEVGLAWRQRVGHGPVMGGDADRVFS